MLIGLFLEVFCEERYSLRILENLYLHTFLPQHLLIPAEVRHVSDHQSLELKLVNQCRTDIARAQRSEHGGLAEIKAPGIASGGSFAVIVRMPFLYQRIVPFTDNFPRIVVDDHSANGRAALFVSLFREQESDAH